MWCVEAKLKENITLDGVSLLVGHPVTITNGLREKYCLWHNTGLYDLNERCVGEIVKEISS